MMTPDDALDVELGVSDFVALLNQTMEYAYPSVIITGELANLRVSKNRWVYFELKDDSSSVKFFATIYQLPGPLENGMILRVRGAPKLHNLYGFSVTVASMQPAGEGTIKRAAELLEAKLLQEGLFDPTRKRALPYPPRHIGLIASRQSAAYADFVKILDARWQGTDISLIDVQVQGEPAPSQIIAALEQFNKLSSPPDVIVMIRGGGSPEDMAAFSTEQVTRAVAASRIPTLVAIGHEVDVCLAELAADVRGSTPSNAAELLVPDRQYVLTELYAAGLRLHELMLQRVKTGRVHQTQQAELLTASMLTQLAHASQSLRTRHQLLSALSPQAILQRGYALVRRDTHVVRRGADLVAGDGVTLQFADTEVRALINERKP